MPKTRQFTLQMSASYVPNGRPAPNNGASIKTILYREPIIFKTKLYVLEEYNLNGNSRLTQFHLSIIEPHYVTTAWLFSSK